MKKKLLALITVFLLLNTGLFAQPLKSVETLDEDRRTILENLYNGFSGDSWNNNNGWNTANPIEEWSGISRRDLISMPGGHWLTVDLRANNLILSGSLLSSANFANLFALYDEDYNATIDTIDLSENYLTYADLKLLHIDEIVVPDHAYELTYSPQNKIPLKSTTIEVEENNGMTINIEDYYAASKSVQSLPGGSTIVTYSGMYPRDSGNEYSWWGTAGRFWMYAGGGKDFTLPQSLGTYQYYCMITNPDFPELTLITETITVNVVNVDREALAALYEATGGDNWTNNTNWLDDNAPLDTWYGVTADPVTGRVTELNLYGNNLNGTLPDEFFNADELTSLYLSSNSNLTGSIPDAVGNLIKLETCQLYDCDFNGQIPEIISNLSSLKVLGVYNNNLTGSVPATFSNINSLVNLYMNGNNLSGDLPDLSNVSDYLRIENNNFTFDNMQLINSNASNFTYSPQADVVMTPDEYSYNIYDDISIDCGLDASNTFQWFRDATVLVDDGPTLDISNALMYDAGQYHCEITNPAFPDLTLSTTIVSIDIVNDIDRQALEDLYIATDGDNWTDNTNWLDDEVPLEDWYGINVNSSGRVDHINLHDNNLSGQLPASLSNLSELEALTIWSNDFAGPIPSSYGQLSNLSLMTISSSGLTGTIPEELGNLSSLTYLVLTNNELEGSIPSTFSNLSNLGDLLVNSNNLSGELPDLSMVDGMLHVNQNKFVYADFETANVSSSADFKYLGQYYIEPSQRDFSVDQGDDLTINIEDYTSLRHTGNIYHWYKGAEEISDTKTLQITIATVDDAGTYSCGVSNPEYPELDLSILSVSVSVNETNSPPYLVNPISDQTITTGDSWSFFMPLNTFEDPDGDPLSYSGSGLPEWASFNEGTLEFTGVAGETGTHEVSIVATDNISGSAIATFTLNVEEEPNNAPVAIAGDDQSVEEQIGVTLDGSSSYDPDGDAITYSWTAPAGITLDDNTLQTPQFTAPEVDGDTTITITLHVSDGVLSGVDSVSVTIQNNTAVISPTEIELKIWPNPAVQNINVLLDPGVFEPNSNLKAFVFDLSGRLVAQENLIKQTDNMYFGSIKVSQLKKGIYFVKSGNENISVMHKILIKK
ncbi:MAG: putative Ig domain-containing protein [Prolixibacteraceae bacterium]|jgi:Leucine-rich repeat (LRR) protein|nr:putative Ig domain-containing protein [Prolixibacteraceae bacterium]